MNRSFHYAGAGFVLAGVLFIAACGSATDDDDSTVSCSADSDCQVINDCCAGCYAANMDEVLDSCLADCAQSACDAEYGAGSVVEAVCSNGQCTLEVDPVCETDEDCKVIDDCAALAVTPRTPRKPSRTAMQNARDLHAPWNTGSTQH